MRRPPVLGLALATALVGSAGEAASQASGIRFSIEAADSILSSVDAPVGLEGFKGEAVTGVYLYGSWRGEQESIAYGIDHDDRRYVWFAVQRGDGVEHIAMLLDVDRDLTPEFLLFRTVDRTERSEEMVEYRTREIMDVPIEIQVQPDCAPPACDPAEWTISPRQQVQVPAEFFAPWRAIFGLAAVRGESWLGKPKSMFLSQAAPEPPEP